MVRCDFNYIFISGVERDQRTQPYKDKQNDFSRKLLEYSCRGECLKQINCDLVVLNSRPWQDD